MTCTALVLVFSLLAMVLVSAEAVAKTTKEIVLDAEGNKYNLNITEHEHEEDLDLSDSQGNHIVTVELFNEQGYQIDKPANESVCLLVQLLEKGEEAHECYRRESIEKSSLSTEILTHCEGRDIYVLVPSEVNCEEAKATANQENEVTTAKSGLIRQKRAWITCGWYAHLTIRYHIRSYCCLYLFGRCTLTCSVPEWYVTVYYVYQCTYWG